MPIQRRAKSQTHNHVNYCLANSKNLVSSSVFLSHPLRKIPVAACARFLARIIHCKNQAPEALSEGDNREIMPVSAGAPATKTISSHQKPRARSRIHLSRSRRRAKFSQYLRRRWCVRISLKFVRTARRPRVWAAAAAAAASISRKKHLERSH